MTDHIPPSVSSSGHSLLSSLAGTTTADGTDLLATREEALTWLHAAGLLPDDAAISNSEHGALVRLRDALREVIDARAAGMAAPDAAARLSRALADGRLVVTVSSTISLISDLPYIRFTCAGGTLPGRKPLICSWGEISAILASSFSFRVVAGTVTP